MGARGLLTTTAGRAGCLQSARIGVLGNGGRSMVANAVNQCSGKMKAVWALADQEGLLEKETYTDVAEARAGLQEARQAFEKAEEEESAPIFDLQRKAA